MLSLLDLMFLLQVKLPALLSGYIGDNSECYILTEGHKSLLNLFKNVNFGTYVLNL